MVVLTGFNFPQFNKLKHHLAKKGLPISFKITELFFLLLSFYFALFSCIKLRNSYSQLANEVNDQKANSAVLLNK